ncbi:WRKY DNA-binding transcription factor 70-like [Phragmites australis]|uniref:WRKY DNA-binding transcription factor 70-like n=1 Tax=Phragmites australis TaxID=29695 RepID=UPI002D764CE9|nr:WRKY DNA-binding transcription factor 70-like [Phragmites australis]
MKSERQGEEMKHHHHHHDRNLLQYSPSDYPSLACDHRSAMKEIAREQSLVTQLRAIVLPALQVDERSQLVAQMFQGILDCSSKAIAQLQLHRSDAPRVDVLVDDKKRVKTISDDCISKEEIDKPHHQHKRRRYADSVSLETPVPHYDGHQWRKYGQKHINKAKHPRSYYRCTYRQEQDCKATKTVQQHDDSAGVDHAVMYTVVYHGQHTCNGNNGDDSATDDAETNTQSSSALVHSDSQCSVSVTCSSDPNEHQMPLDDSNKLLDKSADLITNTMYEPFEMTEFAPFDSDSWELDALLRFGV